MNGTEIPELAPERTLQRLGNYTIVREAGRGGMSVVYEGRDERIGRRVAIKTVRVPPHLSQTQRDETTTRLRREARAIARLSHPNVVSVYDVGEESGAHFLVMEYLEGQTLRERLNAGPLSSQEAAGILDQVASALDSVHAEGVVHRDIKPSNVMLLPDGRVKLMDFGVARQTDDTLLTQAGMMVGSPAYMAPELINGENATQASDVWSLGVLLYQMLKGRPPFDSKNIPTVLYQVTHQDPEPVPGASPPMQKVLARALEKNPARRYSSGGEMAAAFRAALSDSPHVLAARLPRPARTQRPARPRSWGPLLAGVLALLLFVSALLGGQWLAIRHRTASAPLTVHQAARTQTPHIQQNPSTKTASASRTDGVTQDVKTRPVVRVRVGASRQERVQAAAPVRANPTRRIPRRHLAVATPSSQPVSVRRVRRARRANPPNKPFPANTPTQTAGAVRAAADTLSGTWHGWQGIHSHDPAVLTIQRSRGADFDGVMTVRTPDHATVRVALTGRVQPGGGVTMRETRVLSSTKPNAWDLGFKTGRIGPNGQMSGSDHDIKGRRAQWSFQR